MRFAKRIQDVMAKFPRAYPQTARLMALTALVMACMVIIASLIPPASAENTSGFITVQIQAKPPCEIEGTIDQGVEVGRRYARGFLSLIASSTVATRGCKAVDEYRDHVASIVREIDPVDGKGSAFTVGFYEGVLDAIEADVQKVIGKCGRSGFRYGKFSGVLYGNIACAAAHVDLVAVMGIRFPKVTAFSGMIDLAERRFTQLDCVDAFRSARIDCRLPGNGDDLMRAIEERACESASH